MNFIGLDDFIKSIPVTTTNGSRLAKVPVRSSIKDSTADYYDSLYNSVTTEIKCVDVVLSTRLIRPMTQLYVPEIPPLFRNYVIKHCMQNVIYVKRLNNENLLSSIYRTKVKAYNQPDSVIDLKLNKHQQFKIITSSRNFAIFKTEERPVEHFAAFESFYNIFCFNPDENVALKYEEEDLCL